MGVILVGNTGGGGGGSSDHTHSNMATLNALTATANNELKVNGVLVGEKAIEILYSKILNAQDIARKYLELPNDCDISRAISLVFANVPQMQGAAWEVIENADPIPDRIAWAGLTLEKLALIGDPVEITYYKKRS